MGKAGIPPSISEETVLKVVQKTDLKWTQFQRKEILTKKDLKLRLKFDRKVCAAMKYEIIRKSIVQTWIDHVWKVAISFSNLNFSHI